MAAPTNPTWLDYPFANNGDKNVISSTTTDTGVVNMQYGFPSKFSAPRADSGKSVSRKDMNGILNAMSSMNYYFQYMGRNPYVSGKSYPQGAKVWFTGDSDTTGEYIQSSETDTTVAPPNSPWIKINNLAGTVGGGSGTCAYNYDTLSSFITSSLASLETSVKQAISTAGAYPYIDYTGFIQHELTRSKTTTLNISFPCAIKFVQQSGTTFTYFTNNVLINGGSLSGDYVPATAGLSFANDGTYYLIEPSEVSITITSSTGKYYVMIAPLLGFDTGSLTTITSSVNNLSTALSAYVDGVTLTDSTQQTTESTYMYVTRIKITNANITLSVMLGGYKRYSAISKNCSPTTVIVPSGGTRTITAYCDTEDLRTQMKSQENLVTTKILPISIVES